MVFLKRDKKKRGLRRWPGGERAAYWGRRGMVSGRCGCGRAGVVVIGEVGGRSSRRRRRIGGDGRQRNEAVAYTPRR